MIIHNIAVDLYVGPKQKVASWPALQTTDLQINWYGSLWGERQVLDLGYHFTVYKEYKKSAWILADQMGYVSPDSLSSATQLAISKLPGGSVSGNFGEVLTILVLESRLTRPLRVSHLCPIPKHKNLKCPDLLVETTPLQEDYTMFRNKVAPPLFPELMPPPLPDILPGECKNSDFLGALRQIAAYWHGVQVNSPLFGFGLIAQINYNDPPLLRFTILAPKSTDNLQKLLASRIDTSELISKNFKGSLYGF